MSIMEIPDALYQIIYTQEVANALAKDPYHNLQAARERAQEIMGHCFCSRSIIECQENEKDRWEYLEEQSLGGTPYEEPR